jgi:hypothetical protein
LALGTRAIYQHRSVKYRNENLVNSTLVAIAEWEQSQNWLESTKKATTTSTASKQDEQEPTREMELKLGGRKPKDSGFASQEERDL